MQPPFRAATLAAFCLSGLFPAALYAQMASPYGYGPPYPAPSPYGQSPYGYGQPGYDAPRSYGYSQPQNYGYGAAQPDYPRQTYDQPPGEYGYTQPNYAQPSSAQSLNAAQLEQLVAPIALDPDTLVAEELAASTYPQQVLDADRWVAAQGNASPYEIAGGADAQQWDPSVKALTAFPQVLAEMDRNRSWMAALGNAYYNQPQDVMQAIQVMRQRAQAAGTLRSTPQEQMTYDQGNIELAPPTPDEVYVPQYDPWNSYGDPVTPYPGFSLLGAIGDFFSSTIGPGLMNFGPGILMGAFNHTPFGWVSWALSWLTDAISLGHSTWGTHSSAVVDWGLPYGGPRAYLGVRAGYRGSAFGYRAGAGEPGRGVARPWNGYAGRSAESVDRATYRRGPEEAYSRTPAPIVRSQSYGRPENSFANRPQEYARQQQGYSGHPENRLAYGPEVYNGARGFASPESGRGYSSQAYRGSERSMGRGSFYSRPESSFRGGESYAYRGGSAYKAPKSSGGFHLFGGGGSHEYKQPKMEYKAPKMPKMSGHSFGGGGHSSSHSSGGGHSSRRGNSR